MSKSTTAHLYTKQELVAAIRRLMEAGISQEKAVQLVRDAYPEAKLYL